VDNSIAESLALTANEDALIALLEESAFAMDERAIVGANQAAAVQPALAETAVEVETAGNADTVIMPTAAIVETATNDTPAVLSAKPGEIILDDIEAADIGPVVAIEQADPGFAPMLATDQVVEQVGTSADAISKIPAADWYESLQSRHQFVESMPVIGAAGPLAFVGRALQRADAFVATSPSWATLVFGAWVTLLVVMLRNELVSRRRRLPVAAAGKPAVATGVTRAGPAAEVPPAPAVSEGPAGKTRSRHLPAQPPSESNARLIIAQADSILAGGDAEEAIKLMKLAVELQPNQSMLVNRLLELYHQTRRADDFARLLDDSLTVLENLDPGDIAKLQTMHSRLLAGIAFPLAHVQAAASETMLAKDPIDARHAEQALPANDEEIDELAKPGAAEEIDMPLFAASGTAVDDIAVDDDSDRRVMATGVSEDFSHRFDALAAAAESRHDDEDFVETQVIYTDDGVPLREEAVERQSVVGEILDLDVTLKEADVYLAYGLYESAEELLLKGLEVDPNRADFLARLLDAYYATRNLVDFVACAEVMLDMGEAGREHWEKVEIMGYELAPYNKMFAGGKDRSLSAVELGIPRPETADFDFSDIEADRLQAATDIAIDRDEEAEAMAADLNLDLATSDYEDTADKLDQILSLDTSDTPAIPAASRHFDDDDISSFVIDDDGHVDDSASEGGHFRSLLTSEILAIPETAENADHEDSLSFDPDSANELDDITTGDEQLRSLETSEILGIPETSTQADIEDDVVFEIDEDALAMDLDAVGEELELDLDGESAADDDDPDDADLDFADEEVMKFTIENTLDGLAASLDTGETSLSVVENPSAEAAANPGAEIADGRILYFPENNNEGRAISEFESEVKVTLQAIRDQLQHITERLFRQERETNELKQVIAELGKDDVAAGKKKNKKSS
jgi:tetratricopeptide (TPR) repeat protein